MSVTAVIKLRNNWSYIHSGFELDNVLVKRFEGYGADKLGLINSMSGTLLETHTSRNHWRL